MGKSEFYTFWVAVGFWFVDGFSNAIGIIIHMPKGMRRRVGLDGGLHSFVIKGPRLLFGLMIGHLGLKDQKGFLEKEIDGRMLLRQALDGEYQALAIGCLCCVGSWTRTGLEP